MEPGLDREHRSEDVLAFDARDWSPEAEARARYLDEQIGLLRERREFAYTFNEYPAVPSKHQELYMRLPRCAHSSVSTQR
jgi:hypothetical protein